MSFSDKEIKFLIGLCVIYALIPKTNENKVAKVLYNCFQIKQAIGKAPTSLEMANMSIRKSQITFDEYLSQGGSITEEDWLFVEFFCRLYPERYTIDYLSRPHVYYFGIEKNSFLMKLISFLKKNPGKKFNPKDYCLFYVLMSWPNLIHLRSEIFSEEIDISQFDQNDYEKLGDDEYGYIGKRIQNILNLQKFMSK